jgi:5-methylcytosine-specific restriction protein B
VLHCKEPTRWFPAQSGMLAEGYSLLVGITPEDGPSYVRCCAALRALVAEHGMPPVGLDIAAWFAGQPDELDLDDAVEAEAATAPAPAAVSYDRATFLAETLFMEGELADVERLLRDKPQIVLHGPPGTGKTWIAERLARYLTGGDRERVGVVQFHPSYGYEDFIEGIRPRSDGARVTYPVERGVFLEFCERAALRPDELHVLVIDEINRGNLPRIFGELLFALERRGEPVTLAQSRRTMRVPGNVVLIGTMNTADQSIAPIDLALRRRFHFVRLKPEPERLESWLATHAPAMKAVAAVLGALNAKLEQFGVPHDRLVGHSHFMRRGLNEAGLELLWRASIMPLIEELLHGQDEAIGGFEHAAFVVPRLAPAK